MLNQGFLILDFGSQVTQLIARRLREMGHYCEIQPWHWSMENIRAAAPKGIILSGGPASVYEKDSPQKDVRQLAEVAPLMGICYGMQLMAQGFGGRVHRAEQREYGHHQVSWKIPVPEVPTLQKVWMSHGDVVDQLPEGFSLSAVSENQHPAAMVDERRKLFAVQFHPEVVHSEKGSQVLKYFTQVLCQASTDWTAPHLLEVLQKKVLQQVGPKDHVLCALSGGVDSSVLAVLLTKTLGRDRVYCVFVNNGLLRKNEFEDVLHLYQDQGLNIRGVDAKNEFLSELAGVEDPETKRKIIGRVFIEVFDKNLSSEKVQWLAQGTLYPDVIESVSALGGPSQTIKSHHNVGGLPEKMKLKLLEPFRELFKDEVRLLGQQLGLPETLVQRHPFPGPGLSIRVLGEVNEEALSILREADAIFIRHLREKNLYSKVWQAFCVLLPVKTVGVQGDGRTYEKILALRAVTSIDGMTADWYPFTHEFLRDVSSEITNKVRGVNRVVMDITSKPPATIEWE